jgi:hypothetical protein
VSVYDADQLRQFLELWERDGHLGGDQMRALVEWDETPEDVRARLMALVEERDQVEAHPEPLTAKGDLLDESPSESVTRSRLGRLLDRVRLLR